MGEWPSATRSRDVAGGCGPAAELAGGVARRCPPFARVALLTALLGGAPYGSGVRAWLATGERAGLAVAVEIKTQQATCYRLIELNTTVYLENFSNSRYAKNILIFQMVLRLHEVKPRNFQGFTNVDTATETAILRGKENETHYHQVSLPTRINSTQNAHSSRARSRPPPAASSSGGL